MSTRRKLRKSAHGWWRGLSTGTERFINGYREAPEEIVLDIDGWDDPTHGQHQLSCFHGYYGQHMHMYFPVLINEASTGYPLATTVRLRNWQQPHKIKTVKIKNINLPIR